MSYARTRTTNFVERQALKTITYIPICFVIDLFESSAD